MRDDFNPATLGIFVVPIIVFAVLILYLKGLALWRAARGGKSKWFIAMLLINSAGILPIIYLLKNKATKKSQK